MSQITQRKAIEKTYTDTCSAYIFRKVKDGAITKQEKAFLFENMKCALSQKTLNTSNQGNVANIIHYDATLFIAPEITIPPGSYIEVVRMSRIYRFISSGEAFVYETHQEIMLLRNDKA